MPRIVSVIYNGRFINWAEGALFSVSASVRKIDGLIRNDLVEESPNYWVTFPSNLGDATTRSLELEAKFPLKAVLDNAPALDGRCGFAGNHGDAVLTPSALAMVIRRGRFHAASITKRNS